MQGHLFDEYPYTPSDDLIRRELLERAYADLPFRLGEEDCNELYANFDGFIELFMQPGGEVLSDALHYDVHQKLNSTRAPEHKLHDGVYFFEYRQPGVTNRREQGRAPGTDEKYTLHFGPQSTERAKVALGGALPAEMAVLMENCEEFYDELTRTMHIGAVALGVEEDMFSGQRENDVHVLRVLKYIASQRRALAGTHFDRSRLTVAPKDSRPGLYGVGGNNGYLIPVTVEYIRGLEDKLQPIEHQEKVAKLFLGAGVNRAPKPVYAKLADLPLMAHNVINLEPGETRLAVVGFGNPHQDASEDYYDPKSEETGLDDIAAHIALAA